MYCPPTGPSVNIEKRHDRIECDPTSGIDRCLYSITTGNDLCQESHDLSEIVKIGRRTRNKTSHFTRNGMRIGRQIKKKYGMRNRNRIDAILHEKSRRIVDHHVRNREVLVLEDIRHINGILTQSIRKPELH